MPELNEDGLVPGQPVDFETLMRFSRKGNDAKQAEKAKRSKPAAVVKDDGQAVVDQPQSEQPDQA